MKRALMMGLFVACVTARAVAGGIDAGADAGGADCAALASALRAQLDEARANPLRLANPPRRAKSDEDAGSPCEHADDAARGLVGSESIIDLQRGSIGGRRAAVWSDGPSGSGRYWTLTVAIAARGGWRGVCFTTSTAGWRNLPARAQRSFGRWRALAGNLLHVWSGLAGGATQSDDVIVPLVYRLDGDTLALDWAATRQELSDFARRYDEAAALHEDNRRELHRAAAQAYRAAVGDAACPR